MAQQYSTFYVPMGENGTAQEALNAFLASHRVLGVDKCFAGNGWTFCVEWLDGAPVRSLNVRAGAKIDYRAVLSPEDFAKFARLRALRKEMAAEDGVAPYMILTDAQLAEVVKLEAPSPTALKKINGFGEARCEKYGERILSELRNMSASENGADEKESE